MRFHVTTLSNGLTVLLVEDHAAPVVTFWVWYRVGGRNEMPGYTGISHWVEHMLFKGTPRHPKGTLTRYIDRLGGRWNAFTWKDYTAYFEVLPAEHLAVAIDLEADRMVNTVFEPAEVESERTVIISEREGAENSPGYLLQEEVDGASFKVHPYRFPVIGWKDDLRMLSSDDLFRYYRTYYYPNNAIVVAVGDFSTETALAHIRESFEELPPGPTPPPVRAQEPGQEGERRVVLRRPGGATEYLHLAYHIPAGGDSDLAPLLVLDGILSGFKSITPFEGAIGRRSSRLYRALIEESLASDVSSGVTPSVDPTVFRILATARGNVSSEAIEHRILVELDRLAREPVEAAELAKIKKQAKAQFTYGQDGVVGKAMARGQFTLVDGPEAFERLPERIDRVTADDVMRAVRTYFHEKNRTIGWYLPEAGGATTAAHAAHHPGIFWFDRPATAQARVVPLAPDRITRVELTNGLVVLVHETRGSGLVAVHGYVRTGAMHDGDRSGLARFVAATVQRGTRSRSSQDIAEAFDAMGASVAIRPDMEATAFSVRTLREDAAAALEVVGDVLMSPIFPAEEVEKVRGELLTALRIGLQDTRQVAERTFRALAFPPAHPHARLPDGEVNVVEAIQRQELSAFHKSHYRPEATILAIAGDLAVPEALRVIEEVFSPWPRRGVWTLPTVPRVENPSAPLRREVRLAGKTQSDIVFGIPGIARADPVFYETMMANLTLGQLGMMGRLGNRIRERQGMAYYAFSDLRAGLLAGPWWIKAGVNPQNEDRAITGIQDEVRQFQEEGPGEDELADARAFLVGSLAIRLETNPGIVQMLADIELFGLGLDYLIRYPEIIGGITHEAVQRAARTFILHACCLAIAGPEKPS